MSRKYRLSTALDVDDLLMECTEYAIRLANEEHNFEPPMTIYEKNQWGRMGTRSDAIYPYFRDPEFYRTQPVYKGAKEFVRRLSQMTEVYICTAVPPEYMGIRAQRIREEFPEIPEDHIYMGARKDKIHVDMILRDLREFLPDALGADAHIFGGHGGADVHLGHLAQPPHKIVGALIHRLGAVEFRVAEIGIDHVGAGAQLAPALFFVDGQGRVEFVFFIGQPHGVAGAFHQQVVDVQRC